MAETPTTGNVQLPSDGSIDDLGFAFPCGDDIDTPHPMQRHGTLAALDQAAPEEQRFALHEVSASGPHPTPNVEASSEEKTYVMLGLESMAEDEYGGDQDGKEDQTEHDGLVESRKSSHYYCVYDANELDLTLEALEYAPYTPECRNWYTGKAQSSLILCTYSVCCI